MVNLAAATRQAMGIAKSLNLLGTVTITRPASTITPTTGATTGTPSTQSLDAAEMKPVRIQAKGNSAFVSAKAALFVEAAALSWTPRVGDHAQWNGRTGHITAIDPVAPAGSAIGYEIAVGD